MAYIASIWMRPITVAEITLFIRQAADVWSDEERSTFGFHRPEIPRPAM
jgi:hypothetical protein